jgi:uncharacterized membrane protein
LNVVRGSGFGAVFSMQYRWAHLAEPGQQQWLLKRNCAMSPRQLARCFGVLATVSLAISAAFALRGAWLVVPFACIEIVALGVAFVVYARHAADYERIVLAQGRVLVERASAGTVARLECEPAWLRVEYGGSRRDLIRLVSGREQVDVGRFVPAERREELARELRASFARWRG